MAAPAAADAADGPQSTRLVAYAAARLRLGDASVLRLSPLRRAERRLLSAVAHHLPQASLQHLDLRSEEKGRRS